MDIRTRSMIALAAVCGLALTACGGNWSQSDVESDVGGTLDDEFPEEAPHELDCPADLEAEEGEQMTCDFTDAYGAGTLDVHIVEVDGSDIEFEVEFLSYE